MSNELVDCERAIQLRLAGELVEAICQRLKRSEVWSHKWWRRYLTESPEGLYELSRAPRAMLERIAPHIERTIVSVRRRLEAHAAPETHYQRSGAPTVQAELKALHLSLVPLSVSIEKGLSARLDRNPIG